MHNTYKNILSKSKIFYNINTLEYQDILKCLHAHIVDFNENQLVFNQINHNNTFGILLEGCIDFNIIKSDGNLNLIKRLYSSDSIGEMFACSNTYINSLEYKCVYKSKVLFMDIPRACTDKCACNYKGKYKVMENMLKIVSEDNIFLQKKIFILSQQKLRDKLLHYIHLFKTVDSKEIWIPFNRQDLANFISADRSAVSRELSKMQKDGLIEINSNKIKIL